MENQSNVTEHALPAYLRCDDISNDKRAYENWLNVMVDGKSGDGLNTCDAKILIFINFFLIN